MLPELGRLRQKDHFEFKATLEYIRRMMSQKGNKELGLIVHAHYSNTWIADIGGSGVLGNLQLHIKFEASLGYNETLSQKKKNPEGGKRRREWGKREEMKALGLMLLLNQLCSTGLWPFFKGPSFFISISFPPVDCCLLCSTSNGFHKSEPLLKSHSLHAYPGDQFGQWNNSK